MVEANQTFSIERLTQLAATCSSDENAVPIDEFCDLLDMIVNLLRHMGTAMSLASNGK